MLAQKVSVVALALGLAAGCAEQHINRSHGFVGDAQRTFWPPPPPTTLWTSDAGADTTLGDAALRVAETLRRAGQGDLRWYPIGVGYAHGFAVTTRLERIDADARPAGARWDPLYDEASSLEWLKNDSSPRVSAPGRYRLTLVAFTDLPPREAHAAPRWNEGTWMDGPDAIDRRIPGAKHAGRGYQVRVYVYEYATKPGEVETAPAAAVVGAEEEVERAGLEELGAVVR